MLRRDFLRSGLWLGASALAGCQRPKSSAGGKVFRIIHLDLKTGQEIANKTSAPQSDGLSYFLSRPNPAFGFVEVSQKSVRLIEADSAKVHPLEPGLIRTAWFQVNACVAGNDEKTVLVDLGQNKIVWTNSDRTASAAERIVSDAGVVLLAHRGGVLAIDLKSGKTIWKDGSLGSPGFLRIWKDQAVVGLFHSNRIEFRNLKTGKVSGKLELPGRAAIPGDARMAGDTLLVACPRHALYAYREGKLVWQFKLKESEYYPRILAGDGSVCFFEPEYHTGVHALDVQSGKKLWSGPTPEDNDYTMAGGLWLARHPIKAGGLIAREARTGKVLWTKEMLFQQLCVNDRRVALLGEV